MISQALDPTCTEALILRAANLLAFGLSEEEAASKIMESFPSLPPQEVFFAIKAAPIYAQDF